MTTSKIPSETFELTLVPDEFDTDFVVIDDQDPDAIIEARAPAQDLSAVTEFAHTRIHYTIKFPRDSELVDNIPVILGAGLGAPEMAYDKLSSAIALTGRMAIIYTPPRTQSGARAYMPHDLLHPLDLQSKAIWGVMKAAKEKIEVDQFHIVGHSTGGQTGSTAALHHPESVRSLILVGSAGLDGHKLPNMGPRAFRFVRHELVPAIIKEPTLAIRALLHNARSPGRLMREAVAVSNCDTRANIQALRQLHIPVAALQLPDDSFFPLEKQAATAQIVDDYRSISDPRANHLAPQLKAQEVAEMIDFILTTMQFGKRDIAV